MPRFIVVLGSIMSGLGKGILSASIGKVLQARGFSVAPIKFDGYLNVDCGTMNPFRHGEVFVLADGTEVDMDFGTYERFLGLNLNKRASLTGGKIFQRIIEKERKGDYLGRDVQFVPHVTDYIKTYVKDYAKDLNADFVLIEVGGTVGDIENSYFIEAMRQLSLEEEVLFIQLTYLPDLYGELKTKPTQHASKMLLGMGIQPNIIITRSDKPIDATVREKLRTYCNVEHVFNDTELKTVYELPLRLEAEGLWKAIQNYFSLPEKSADLSKWADRLRALEERQETKTIAIVGKYTKQIDSYASLREALHISSTEVPFNIRIKYVEAENVERDTSPLHDADGIIVPGGFGNRGVEGKIKAIEYARKNHIPYLGICFGMQLMVVEYARNVLGLDACSEELGKCADPVIILQPEQEGVKQMGGTLRLGDYEMEVKPGTILSEIYEGREAVERHRHRYEVNPTYVGKLEEQGLIVSAYHKGLVEAVEYDRQKWGFGIGLQAHPEFTAKFEKPSPVFTRFLKEVGKWTKQ